MSPVPSIDFNLIGGNSAGVVNDLFIVGVAVVGGGHLSAIILIELNIIVGRQRGECDFNILCST